MLLALCLPVSLVLLLTLVVILLEGVLADGGVGLAVQLLQTIGLDIVVKVLDELGLVALLVIVGQGLHVLGDVATEDVPAEGVGIEFLGFLVVAGESLLVVWDEETAVGGTLHGTKDTGTGRGSVETDVEEALEWAALLSVNLGGFGELVLTVRLFNTGEILVQVELLESTAGQEETGGVGSGPVGQTVLDSISLKLVCVGGAKDLVSREFGGDQLADDVAVGEAHDHSVLGSVVLVLGLGDQSLTSIVIGLQVVRKVSEVGLKSRRPRAQSDTYLSGSSTLVLGLEARKVRRVLDSANDFVSDDLDSEGRRWTNSLVKGIVASDQDESRSSLYILRISMLQTNFRSDMQGFSHLSLKVGADRGCSKV